MFRRFPAWLSPVVAGVAILVSVVAGLVTVIAGSKLGMDDVSLGQTAGGSCFDRPDDVAPDVLGISVSCSEPHSLEVYASFALEPEADGGPFEEQIAATCASQFESYSGIAAVDVIGELQLLRFVSGELMVGGDVLCTVSAANGRRLNESIAENGDAFLPNRDAGEGRGDIAAGELKVGDCTDAVAGAITTVPIVPCASAHEREVFSVIELELDEYPGRGDLAQRARAECLERFDEYVGEPWATSSLDAIEIAPSEASWGTGDREVVCLLYRLDGEKMVGSRRAGTS